MNPVAAYSMVMIGLITSPGTVAPHFCSGIISSTQYKSTKVTTLV